MTTISNSHTNYNDTGSLDRKILSIDVFDQLFTKARSHHHWTDKGVSDEDLKALYEIIKFGPTSGNLQPARIINDIIDKTFFKGTSWKANFICTIGYGDDSKLHLRDPRLSFEEACRFE